uniref:Mitochondrial RNA binding complex 1 subunit n=1 Tax=Trypanosoma congolense (strain IL3000) TaxID=1068625 RepID=G0US83_TRYCI|nr:conserved hypothetical protein [Trypanosoma congolense IL3000]
MLRLTALFHSKRTPGYVFWRQSTLVELEHAKRNYLLSERPLPIADIARRMVRVKSRYTGTRDFQERNLLRGEYKYFSGKSCDIRHARPEDMIAYVECGSFFGFWDAAQMDRILQELLLKLDELSPVELLHLFTSLQPLRKHASDLNLYLSRRLVGAVSHLTVSECIRACAACDETTPPELMHNLMQIIGPEVSSGGLSGTQCVELLDMLGAYCSQRSHSGFEDVLRDLKHVVVAAMSGLSAMDIAVACTSLKLRGDLDADAEREAIRLFTSRLTECCARSVAMMFTAVGGNVGFTQAMEERVIFLATDFMPDEMLGVFRAYMADFTSTCVVSRGITSGCVGVGHVTGPHLVHRHRTTLFHVIRELMDQMVSLLESAAAYVSPTSQLQYVAVFCRAVEDLDGDVVQLLNPFPQLGQCMQLLSAKLIASLKQYTYSELVAVLQMCNTLGKLLTDAVIGATVQEIIRREVSTSGSEAMLMYAVLRQLKNLRSEYLVRIERDILPRLYEKGSHRV